MEQKLAKQIKLENVTELSIQKVVEKKLDKDLTDARQIFKNFTRLNTFLQQ